MLIIHNDMERSATTQRITCEYLGPRVYCKKFNVSTGKLFRIHCDGHSFVLDFSRNEWKHMWENLISKPPCMRKISNNYSSSDNQTYCSHSDRSTQKTRFEITSCVDKLCTIMMPHLQILEKSSSSGDMIFLDFHLINVARFEKISEYIWKYFDRFQETPRSNIFPSIDIVKSAEFDESITSTSESSDESSEDEEELQSRNAISIDIEKLAALDPETIKKLAKLQKLFVAAKTTAQLLEDMRGK